MNLTAQNAVLCRPSYKTVAGSTISLGAITGLRVQNPTSSAAAGTQTMVSYIGLDVEALPFGGNVTKAAVRSALVAASNTYCILHTGGAKSRHVGEFHIDEYLIHDGDANTYLRFQTDDFSLAAGGNVRVQGDATGLGFFAATPVAKPTVTGAKGGNVALTSLLTALANLGLITDSST